MDNDQGGATFESHHRPVWGFTRHGRPVHANTLDHLPTHNWYARFNKRVALALTNRVGTMTAFWVFCFISLMALPAVLVESHILSPSIGLIGEAGFALCVAWLAQSFIQLVLLPALMVGQNLQNIAADARSAKTFEDVERIIDLLDCHTQGGLAEVLSAIADLKAHLAPGAPGAGQPGATFPAPGLSAPGLPGPGLGQGSTAG
ncbi:MAG TPA: hypothetical protein VFN61_03595 [Acidimicrobiales bacterium]|nr:hypothetical protein [Acidimicrobiales bacterium]